jgi:hypothetical protein
LKEAIFMPRLRLSRGPRRVMILGRVHVKVQALSNLHILLGTSRFGLQPR